MTDDRREHARAPLSTKATVLVRHNAGAVLAIESISVGGARLVGEITVMLGDPVQMLFEVEGHPLDVAGEVIRIDNVDITTAHVAIRFTDLGNDAKARIEQLVRSFLDFEEQQLKA